MFTSKNLSFIYWMYIHWYTVFWRGQPKLLVPLFIIVRLVSIGCKVMLDC